MNLGFPGWWLALADEARAGLAHGNGPFWSERFFCGQPLFGAPELPFSGPAAAVALAWTPTAWALFHALILAAGLALWLRGLGPGMGVGRGVTAMVAWLVVAGAMHPEGVALLGIWAWLPWTLLLAGSAAPWQAAPFCALLAVAGSPLALLLGLGGSAWTSRASRSWARAWGLGALLSAPALLETLRQAPGVASVAQPAWPLAWLGSPLPVFQGGAALVATVVIASGWTQRRHGLVLLLAASLWAVAPALFRPPASRTAPVPRISPLSRLLAPAGALPGDLAGLEAGTWIGGAGGLAPAASMDRWRYMGRMGQRAPDLLDLSATGWLAGDPEQRWFQGVRSAWVESASASFGTPADAGLYDRPLGLLSAHPDAQPGHVWHVVEAQMRAPGLWQQSLETQARGWAFLSESADAGWTVESKLGPRRPDTAEGHFLALALAQGDGELQWSYRPPWARAGAWLFALGLMVWIAVAGRAWRHQAD